MEKILDTHEKPIRVGFDGIKITNVMIGHVIKILHRLKMGNVSCLFSYLRTSQTILMTKYLLDLR